MLDCRKITKKEINNLKKEVVKATGKRIKDITIEAFSNDFIIYGFYATNYDRVRNIKTTEKIVRNF